MKDKIILNVFISWIEGIKVQLCRRPNSNAAKYSGFGRQHVPPTSLKSKSEHALTNGHLQKVDWGFPSTFKHIPNQVSTKKHPPKTNSVKPTRLLVEMFAFYFEPFWLIITSVGGYSLFEKKQSKWESSPSMNMNIKDIWNHQLG